MRLVLGGACFFTAGDIQRITAFIRRSIRQGYCPTDLAYITSIKLIDTADHIMFRQIFTIPNYVLIINPSPSSNS